MIMNYSFRQLKYLINQVNFAEINNSDTHINRVYPVRKILGINHKFPKNIQDSGKNKNNNTDKSTTFHEYLLNALKSSDFKPVTNETTSNPSPCNPVYSQKICLPEKNLKPWAPNKEIEKVYHNSKPEVGSTVNVII